MYLKIMQHGKINLIERLQVNNKTHKTGGGILCPGTENEADLK